LRCMSGRGSAAMRSEEACTAISAVAERIEASAGPLENAGQRAEAAGGRAEQATDALMSSLSSAAARAEERARAADKRAAQLLERAKDAAEEAVQGASRACERVGKVTDTLALHSTRLAGETVRLSEAVGDCTAVLAEVRTENSRLAGEAGQLGDYNQALRKGAGRLQQAIQFAEACLSRENVSRSIPTELSENLSRVSSASATSLAAAQGQELYSSVPSSSSASSLWRRSLSSAPTQCQLDVAGPPSRVLPPVCGAALRIELPPTSPIAPRGEKAAASEGGCLVICQGSSAVQQPALVLQAPKEAASLPSSQGQSASLPTAKYCATLADHAAAQQPSVSIFRPLGARCLSRPQQQGLQSCKF
jgi:hypothetical protein